VERCFIERGRFVRPFCQCAGVRTRGCSQILERRITDFGADVPFAKIPEKIREHYGVTISASTARRITEAHAAKMRDHELLDTQIPEQQGAQCVIAEMDGSMIPIVSTQASEDGDKPIDRRKTRELDWKEARLCLARKQGSVEQVYQAMYLGNVDDAGNRLAHCAIRAGAGENTHVHCVGDGAPWIAGQVERAFGLNGSYLIDFYHLCEYLAAAAQRIAPGDKNSWLAEQKRKLREGKVSEVIETLKPHVEPDSVPKEEAPVRACHRYMSKRESQMDYKEFLDRDLPIGSGAIESAHRYIIQARLKLAGAWWTADNAHNMLALRTLRANNEWESYWEGCGQQAA
jgi:hypothetical protein